MLNDRTVIQSVNDNLLYYYSNTEFLSNNLKTIEDSFKKHTGICSFLNMH